VVAADAGPMEIEWVETRVLKVAKVVRQSTAEDFGSGLTRESMAETTLRRLEKEICCEARRKGTEHGEACEESRAWESRVMLQR